MTQLGDRKLADISASDIRMILAEFASGNALRADGMDKHGKLKLATINRRKAALSACLQLAARQELPDNAARKVPRLSEPRGRVRYLGDKSHAQDELDRLLAACKNSEWLPIPRITVELSLNLIYF